MHKEVGRAAAAPAVILAFRGTEIGLVVKKISFTVKDNTHVKQTNMLHSDANDILGELAKNHIIQRIISFW